MTLLSPHIISRALIIPVLAATLLAACADAPVTPPAPAPSDPATYLKLSVAATDMKGSRDSRANDTYFGGVEGNGSELINTMRFIVCDGSGTVEHNIIISSSTPASLVETAEYRVKPNDTKTIYLFGNEASLPASIREAISTAYKGEDFAAATGALDWTLTRPDGAPLFTPGQPIPMTEVHTLEIGDPRFNPDGTPDPYTTTLFVTRAATKFAVNVTLDPDYPDTTPLSNVTLSSIAATQYLIPRATEYTPAKTPSSGVDREIISYEVPAASSPAPYTFTLTQSTGNPRAYSCSRVYLTETAPAAYTISLDIDGTTLSAPLPNLPSLPRNTYVIININAGWRGLRCEVILLPYTGIWLNPDFGIERD